MDKVVHVPSLEGIEVVEDVRKDEVEERPKFSEIVLTSCPIVRAAHRNCREDLHARVSPSRSFDSRWGIS